jgi:hypothetical protein
VRRTGASYWVAAAAARRPGAGAEFRVSDRD